jgi:riboflavin synthase
VRVFTRISDSGKCYWAAHSKDIANKIINEHAKNLFSFLLEAGTQSLVSAGWKRGKVNCLALNGEQGWSVILYELDSKQLIVNKVQTVELVYTMTEIEHSDRLTELVRNRKEEVIRLLQKLILHNKEIQKCLQECRRFCFVTMQNTLVTVNSANFS